MLMTISSLLAKVALLAEGVGRNWVAAAEVAMSYRVALLAEGVGRNNYMNSQREKFDVALLAEGVGRNMPLCIWLLVVPCRPPRGGRG